MQDHRAQIMVYPKECHAAEDAHIVFRISGSVVREDG
jgi:hypothetical protein